ncbi:hypothetical protein JG678_00645 [Campylobacter sp. 2018MI35]|uniref:hypothetical protein n=1 Tax=Campylobacter molothri TaxID=1032242 RepID=UPI00190449D6|nr:hypothetical protein [Campylobacter sp. 2018MI35]MBK1999956.1 hypothetical protein [Campylobacter sp. 2018MI35]
MKKVIFLTCLSGNVFYKKGDEALLNLSEALRLKEKGIVDFVSSDDKEEQENLKQENEEVQEEQEQENEELDQTNEKEVQENKEVKETKNSTKGKGKK